MTTISAAGSTLTQQLYQKLFDRLNLDGDDALTLDEISAVDAGNVKVSKAFETFDADADGRVTRAEMTPADTFGADTLNALIQAQSGSESISDQEYLADWFAQTDTDGDGLVSRSEREAAADLRRAAAYDAGYMSDRVVMARLGSDRDQPLSIDDFVAGRMRTLQPTHVSNLSPERQAEIRQLMESLRSDPVQAPPADDEPLVSPEQAAADRAERASGPAGTARFLSREIEGLRAAEAARIAAAPMSDALAARLFQQALNNWTPSRDGQQAVAETRA
ncbi:MAG: EF-hand domain-containing protein [Alphaproteobacteria bacterium]|uniref:EF-hand domain-containing protein n=1 Tax=Brevundimonas sp. TaxID=1871086 RepID=UPI001DB480DF|nr:EF-hand domain-containing protein [Alphaproteobacteria bacterium]MBU1522243.1 EF-hand domain-containing protein [Alphaproteobacteria bacterium]MBU2029118.1 EF-hand domain-containing protein [Alphaproteobacteria bacterium]MBU2165384.1 EF-hand domain-containing protein [Alphaproteobacteria bacterium]MBU2232122.1 EF-hand domain-containing protein [Alphaproteobacteria bacterium]